MPKNAQSYYDEFMNGETDDYAYLHNDPSLIPSGQDIDAAFNPQDPNTYYGSMTEMFPEWSAMNGVTPPPEGWNPDTQSVDPATADYFDRMMGYNVDKLNDPNSPKYLMGSVFRQFDPSQGITPEVLAALNALDIGDFSGSGDKLTVDNWRNGDWGNLYDNTLDVVRGFNGGDNPMWSSGLTAATTPGGYDTLSQGGGGGSSFDDLIAAGVGGGGASAGGGGGQGGSTSTYSSRPYMDVRSVIQQILDRGEGGGLNEDVIDRRVESAREDLERQRKAEMATLFGRLADQGLMDTGALGEGVSGLATELGDIFGGQVRDIYADESQRADDRFIEALSLATGMTIEDAKREVDWYNANTNRELGLGDLSLRDMLGRGGLAIDQAQLGLGYDQLGFQYDQMNNNNLLRTLELMGLT